MSTGEECERADRLAARKRGRCGKPLPGQGHQVPSLDAVQEVGTAGAAGKSGRARKRKLRECGTNQKHTHDMCGERAWAMGAVLKGGYILRAPRQAFHRTRGMRAAMRAC
jgi:hypothetical protein